MTNNIVTVNVSQTPAPTPSTLQSTGAIISVGSTTAAAGSKTLLTSEDDLTPILKAPAAITSLAWSGSVVTVTTTAPHGFPMSATVPMTIAGAAPSGYNGSFTATITGTSAFTYPLVSSPGSETVPGTYVPTGTIELVAAVGTFFAQGSTQSVYLLEIGPNGAPAGIVALGTYITANPGFFYSYLVPKLWSNESTYITFVSGFTGLTKKTYFFTTMTTDNYTGFETIKSVVGMVEADGLPSTEFSLAAVFWVTLHYAPSSVNKVTPLAFSFLFDVTPYPLSGNAAILATFKTEGVNYVGTGAEGGVSNTILFWGKTMDARPFNYWYALDWAQINLDLDLSIAVINGSNDPLAPLYYDQPGVNTLQATAQGTLNRGISFGLLTGPAAVTAVPFATYVAANPSDYTSGLYGGLSASITTARGFENIIFNLNVTDLPAAA